MRLALFDENRLGVVVDDQEIVDITTAVLSYDPDPLTAGWWRALCRDWHTVSERIAAAAASRTAVPLATVTLRAPVLNPSKVIAAAGNYRGHAVQAGDTREPALATSPTPTKGLDLTLKAPSSITDPGGPIKLPRRALEDGYEVYHEPGLVVVVGHGGRDIRAEDAAQHIFGYSIGLDTAVTSAVNRFHAQSHDTFSLVGPWIQVHDDAFMTGELDISLTVDDRRQTGTTAHLQTPVPEIVAHASRIMTLNPGDVIVAGTPAGVGPATGAERLFTSISGIGTMETEVR